MSDVAASALSGSSGVSMGIKTEQVMVIRPVETGRDSMNVPIYKWSEESPVAVVVAPGATTDLEAIRPEGAAVSFTLHFPKSYTMSLRGCRVCVRGGEYRVVGDPQPYTMENTPGLYNRPVEVEAVYG